MIGDVLQPNHKGRVKGQPGYSLAWEWFILHIKNPITSKPYIVKPMYIHKNSHKVTRINA